MTPEQDLNNADETIILGQSTLPIRESSPVQTRKKYEVIKPLGKGGFAWVYLVKNLDLDRLEAIKILSFELEDEEVLDRFVKEARISANFNHQNIITIFEVRKDGSWDDFIVPDKIKNRHHEPLTYFTMSFVEGQTAASIIKKDEKMPIRKVLKLALGTAKALDYAHSKAVIHRDIKPENILVDRLGEAIVMDFGIAKAANQTRKTAAGTFMGTARYVSPEQAMGNDVDGRSDLYSLGITLFELITGRPPFDSDEWMTVLYQHIHEIPPTPSSFLPNMDRDFQNVLLKLLEKDPKDRYQTARELLDPLLNIYTRLGGEEYGTEALDQIATRADIMNQSTPSNLESHPPIRKGAVKEQLEARKPSPQLVSPKKAHRPRLIVSLSVLSIVVLIAGLWWFTKKEPIQPQPPEPVLLTGSLYLSAFPGGKLVRLEREDGQQVPIKKPVLPCRYELQEGTYSLVISHGNRNKTLKTYVQQGKTQQAHVFFEVDESDYLLEDLK